MKKKTWLTIGAVSLGLGAIPPLRAHAVAGTDGGLASRRATVQLIADRDRDDVRRTNLEFRDLPREVRETVDRHRGDRKVQEATEVRSNGVTRYRVVLGGARQSDIVLHIARDGRLIDERKLSDEPRLLSERGDRDRRSAVPDWVENDRDWRYIRVANLPDAVRRTVDQHKGDDIITEAVKITHGDRTVYRLMFKDQRSGAHRVIRVDRDGTLLGIDRARDEDRVKVNWQSLSPPVKDTIWRESRGQNIENVYRVIRGNRVWYIAEINARGHDRFIRVDNDGRLSGSWAEDPRNDR